MIMLSVSGMFLVFKNDYNLYLKYMFFKINVLNITDFFLQSLYTKKYKKKYVVKSLTFSPVPHLLNFQSPNDSG